MMRNFLCLIVIIVLTSCGSTFVDYDYDKNVDFSTYKSYAYDFENIRGFSEFDEKRFIAATDSVLVSQGYIFSDSPDMIIGATSSTFESASQNTLGVGIGGGGGNVGVGVSGGIPIGGRELNRELTLTIYDANKNTTIWEATSESRLKLNATPTQKEVYFKNLVLKIFKKFPPKIK